MIKPLAHQKYVVNFLKNNRGLLAFHDTGTGKTLTAIFSIMSFLKTFPNRKVFVITPTSLIDNFKKEMKKVDFDNKNISFYSFQRAVNLLKNKEISFKNAFVIIDEAHNLKNKNGVRFNTIFKASLNASRILLLSATPTMNTLYDIAPLISLIKGNKDILKRKELQSILYYPQNMKYLHYFKCVLSIKKMSKKNHPKVEMHDIIITMSKNYEKLYKEVEHNYSPYYSYENPFRFLIGVRLATNKLDTCPKCKEVIKLVKNKKKTLIYSNFLDKGIKLIKNEIKDKYKSKKIYEITGETKKETRQKIVDNFNKENDAILIISKAGSEGLDLKGVRQVIIFDPTWNVNGEKQIIGRSSRFMSHSHLPASQQKVDVYRLYLKKRNEENERIPSADMRIKQLASVKEKEEKNFMKYIKEISIEKDKDCV